MHRTHPIANRHERRALRRFLVLAGRRAGKDRFLSGVAVWRCRAVHRLAQVHRAGEQAVVILLGRDKKQAAILRKYCHGLLQEPALAREVVARNQDVDRIPQRGDAGDFVATTRAWSRAQRPSPSLARRLRTGSTTRLQRQSDEEVVGAAEPSMAMCPDGGLLLLGSSVHRQRGLLYRKYRELHGNDQTDDICWFATSKTMNPRLPQSVVDAAFAEDPHRGGAEFGNRLARRPHRLRPARRHREPSPTTASSSVRHSPVSRYDYAFMDAPPAPAPTVSLWRLRIACCSARTSSRWMCLRERKPPRFVPSRGDPRVFHDLESLRHQRSAWRQLRLVVWSKTNGYGTASSSSPPTTPPAKTICARCRSSWPRRCRLVDSAALRQQLASLERSVSGGQRDRDTSRRGVGP